MDPLLIFQWSVVAIFAAASVVFCLIAAAMVIAFLDDWRNGRL